MNTRRKIVLIAAAVLMAAAVIALCSVLLREQGLRLSDQDSGQTFARIPLQDGDSFSVTFRHSVNKSDVTEIYQRRGSEIWLTGCVYYGFGAGVAEVLEPDWVLETGTHGEMIISNIDTKMTDLTYIVGTVYDHVLEINGEKIILNELCGKNAAVHFSISR